VNVCINFALKMYACSYCFIFHYNCEDRMHGHTCILQEDKLWDWEKLFAEMSGDIKEVWSRISDKRIRVTKSNSGTSDLGIYLPGKAM